MNLTTNTIRSGASQHFQKHTLPPARSFYERELGPLSRPDRRGWAKPKAGCPFHSSRSKTSFSVNVESGAFRCFGCDAHGGDLVDFIRRRDNSDFKSAARSLGAWRDAALTREERLRLDERTVKLRQQCDQAARVKAAERAERIRLRDEVHATAAIYREAAERLSALQRGAAPVRQDEAEHCWQVLSLTLDDLRLTESEYMRACGFAEWELP